MTDLQIVADAVYNLGERIVMAIRESAWLDSEEFRREAAVRILAGLVANIGDDCAPKDAVKWAINCTDALIEKLNETRSDGAE